MAISVQEQSVAGERHVFSTAACVATGLGRVCSTVVCAAVPGCVWSAENFAALDMSVLHKPVMPPDQDESVLLDVVCAALDMSVLQQPVRPIDMSIYTRRC
jgi:hypothetical protein